MTIKIAPKIDYEAIMPPKHPIGSVEMHFANMNAEYAQFSAKRGVGRPSSGKARVTMLLKPETVEKFKATGKGWQARMSDVLDRNAPYPTLHSLATNQP